MSEHTTDSRVGNLGKLALAGTLATFGLIGNASALERAITDANVANEQAVEFNIYLPLRDRDGAEALLKQLHDPTSASYHQWLTPGEFKERFGPQTATVNAITRELQSHGLAVTEV